MAKRALYQATERILAVATDILHIGNSNKDYRISFANFCQYIWMYLTGTYFIEQAVKNISAGNQVTDLSVYEAGGASEKPNGWRIKISVTGGLDAGTYNMLWTGTTYKIGGVELATDDKRLVGNSYIVLEIDKTNSDWKIVDDGRELVYAHYITASAGVTSANNPIDFTTKVHDKYGSVTTGVSWKFTAPKTAIYTISGTVYSFSGILGLHKQNTFVNYIYGNSAPSTGGYGTISYSIPLNKGEYIHLENSANTTNAVVNNIIIKEDKK